MAMIRELHPQFSAEPTCPICGIRSDPFRQCKIPDRSRNVPMIAVVNLLICLSRDDRSRKIRSACRLLQELIDEWDCTGTVHITPIGMAPDMQHR
jgi:hypothetical protein